MNTKIAYLLAASILMSGSLFCTAVNAQGAPAPAGSEPGAGSMPQAAPDVGGGGRRHRGGQGGGDGAGGGEMREQWHQRMMQRFDANHDGTLDDAERAQMKAARQQRMQQMGGGAGGPGGRMGGMGEGKGQKGDSSPMGGGGRGMGGGMSDAQRQERRQRMLNRFDANHDGKLDDTERGQMRDQFSKMGQGGGGRHHRRGGGNWGGGADAGAPGNSAPATGPGGLGGPPN